MKKKKALVVTSLISIVALSMIAIFSMNSMRASPGANGDIYIDPPAVYYATDNGTVCDRFNITVRVRGITVPVFGWQVRVYFRTCYINTTRWWEPTWDPEYVFFGRGTIAVPPSGGPPAYLPGLPPDYNDSATVASTLFPHMPPGFTGDGILCIMEFHICSVPDKGEVISCELNIDNDSTFLVDEVGAVIPDINKINGYYKMSWVMPPRPYQRIQPVDSGIEGVTVKTTVHEGDTIEFDQWHIWNCTDFDVEVKIMNYYAAWGMTNATVWVDFNSTMLDIIGGVANVTINAADWAGPNEVTLIHGVPDYVVMVVRGFQGTQDGGAPVLVATIRFHIIGQCISPPCRPPGDFDESPLSINCTLWNHYAEIPQDPAEPGLVRVGCYMTLPLPTPFDLALSVVKDPTANPCHRTLMIQAAIDHWLADWKGILPNETIPETVCIYDKFLERGNQILNAVTPIYGEPVPNSTYYVPDEPYTKTQHTNLIHVSVEATIFVQNIIDIAITVVNSPPPPDVWIWVWLWRWNPYASRTPEELTIDGYVTRSSAFVVVEKVKGVTYKVARRYTVLGWLRVIVFTPAELIKTITYEYVYDPATQTWSIQKTVDKQLIFEEELTYFWWTYPKDP